MIISHAIRPFRFEGVAINQSLWIDGKPWFTAAAIREFVGLKRKDAVQQIVSRYPYIREFGREIEVTQEKGQKTGRPVGQPGPQGQAKTIDHIPQFEGYGQAKNVQKYILTIYNPTGFLLIVFEAHTPRAEQCKIIAAKIVEAYAEGKLVERNPQQQAVEQILNDYLQSDNRGERNRLMARAMLATGMSHSTFHRWINIYRSNRSPYNKHHRNGNKPLITDEIGAEIRCLFSQDTMITGTDIWKKLGSPKSPSVDTVRRFHKKLKDEFYAGSFPALKSGDPLPGQSAESQAASSPEKGA